MSVRCLGRRGLIVLAAPVGAILAYAGVVYACTATAVFELSPQAGQVGQSVTATVQHFAKSEPATARWNGSTGAVLWTGTSDATGFLTFTFNVPADSPEYSYVRIFPADPTTVHGENGQPIRIQQSFHVTPAPTAPDPGPGSSAPPTSSPPSTTAGQGAPAATLAPAQPAAALSPPAPGAVAPPVVAQAPAPQPSLPKHAPVAATRHHPGSLAAHSRSRPLGPTSAGAATSQGSAPQVHPAPAAGSVVTTPSESAPGPVLRLPAGSSGIRDGSSAAAVAMTLALAVAGILLAGIGAALALRSARDQRQLSPAAGTPRRG